MSNSFKRWVYAKPLIGSEIGLEHFALQEHPIPELKQGQALARVKLINIHSGTRLRMATGQTEVGNTDRTNYACVEIVQSRDKTFKEGDTAACQSGWQDHQIVSSDDGAIGYASASELVKALNGTNSQWNYVFRPALVKMWAPEVLMDMFGTSGMTAYFGVRECGPLAPRDRVVVAGATGSVGSIAAQLAKIAGSHVTGFAGGESRCAWVSKRLGIDGALNYQAPDFEARLREAFPGGIDLFVDGAGGPLTETVAKMISRNGRLFSYGASAALYAEKLATPQQRPSLREMFGISPAVESLLKLKNIKSEAWIVDAFYHERQKAEDDLSRLMLSGRLKAITNVVEGFDNLPAAIVSLYSNSRAGKLQVRF